MLPLELWRLIAYELQVRRKRQSLLNLCLTSATMKDTITPILYGQVELRTFNSISMFSRTIKDFGARLGPYVQSINIGGLQSYRHWHRVDFMAPRMELCLIVGSLPNLRELLVALDPADFHACFGYLAPLPPFSLQKLVVPLIGTPSFYEFLTAQPSITELHLGSEHTLSEFNMSHMLSCQPGLLPNLASITAPISVLKGAVPGRPISQIMIVTELLDWTDPGVTIIAPSTWEPILCGSQVPITSIGFYQSPHSADPWDQLVQALKQFGAHITLEKIRIVETLDPPVTEWSKQETLSQRVNQMKALKEFEQLQSLEFGEMPYISSSATDVLRWLGGMGNVTAWKKCVPSLKQVKIYGVDLPWQEVRGTLYHGY